MAGNSNIVRVPSKNFPQLDLLRSHIKDVLSQKKFSRLNSRTSFIKYNRLSNATDLISAQCDLRLIWGGDETINQIRKSQLPTKSTDITFSDRYSFALIDSDFFINQSVNDQEKLFRVLRGGSWKNNAWKLRSTYRMAYNDDFRFAANGVFRCVKIIE